MKPGDVLAERYTLAESLGRGGFGEVWAAHDRVERVERAIKILIAPQRLRADNRARFLAEARIANAFVHPNLVKVFDVLELPDDALAIVMERLVGRTLGARLDGHEQLPLREVIATLGPIVGATLAVHERGVVHRDIKPDNIFLAHTPWGLTMPKLLDFGIAKIVGGDVGGEPDEAGRGLRRPAGAGAVTSTGAMLGTPCYMAPEQAFGDPTVDRRADVFALGVVLYECFAGCRPIEAANLGQYVKNLTAGAITPLGELRPDLPAELARRVMAMLSLEPAARPGLDVVLAQLTSNEAYASATAARAPAARALAAPAGSASPALTPTPPPRPPTGASLDETVAAPTRRWVPGTHPPARGDLGRWLVGLGLALALGAGAAWATWALDVGRFFAG